MRISINPDIELLPPPAPPLSCQPEGLASPAPQGPSFAFAASEASGLSPLGSNSNDASPFSLKSRELDRLHDLDDLDKKHPSQPPQKNGGAVDVTKYIDYRGQIRLGYKLKKYIFDGILPYRSIAYCSWKAIPSTGKKKNGEIYSTNCPGSVALSESFDAEGNIHFSYFGQQRCRNSWICAECALLIMSKAQKELLEICYGLIKDKHHIFMITFTLPHKINDSIKDSINNLSECLRDMWSGKGSTVLRKKYGLIKISTTKECTFLSPWMQRTKNFLHGAHYHEHATFASTKNIDLEELRMDLVERWTKIALSKEIITKKQVNDVKKHGIIVSCAVKSNETKGNEEITINSLEKLVKYAIKGIGKYVTSSAKLSKHSGRIDSFTLRNLALSDCPEYLPILAEFMDAVKGYPMFRIVPALKKLYLKKVEEKREYKTRYIFNDFSWLIVHSTGQSQHLLKTMKEKGLGVFASFVEIISNGYDSSSGNKVVDDKQLKKIKQVLAETRERKQKEIEERQIIFSLLDPVLDSFYNLSLDYLDYLDICGDDDFAKRSEFKARWDVEDKEFEIETYKDHIDLLNEYRTDKKITELIYKDYFFTLKRRKEKLLPKRYIEYLCYKSLKNTSSKTLAA